MKLRTSQSGFTLAELMVAVSSFSVLLLVCFGAFVFLGHLYYKGATEIKTNEITRTVVEDISAAVQFGGVDLKYVFNDPVDNGWRAYCIGHRKYSFRISDSSEPSKPGVQLDLDSAVTYNFSSLTDNKKANSVFVVSNQQSGCTDADPTDQQRYELLDEKMRLLKFEVTYQDIMGQPQGRLVTVELKIAFGGDPRDMVFDSETFELNGGTIERCKSGQTFCSVAHLKTTVYRKVGLR